MDFLASAEHTASPPPALLLTWIARWHEEVIESSWRLLPGCAVSQPCLGLCSPATRNGQLYRRPSGNRRARGSLAARGETNGWSRPAQRFASPTTLLEFSEAH